MERKRIRIVRERERERYWRTLEPKISKRQEKLKKRQFTEIRFPMRRSNAEL